MPELLCPLCGYNIAVQILLGIDRCSECAFVLPEFNPEPPETLKQRWDEMAEAVRRRVRTSPSPARGRLHPLSRSIPSA
jgi:hypothetical protein